MLRDASRVKRQRIGQMRIFDGEFCMDTRPGYGISSKNETIKAPLHAKSRCLRFTRARARARSKICAANVGRDRENFSRQSLAFWQSAPSVYPSYGKLNVVYRRVSRPATPRPFLQRAESPNRSDNEEKSRGKARNPAAYEIRARVCE